MIRKRTGWSQRLATQVAAVAGVNAIVGATVAAATVNLGISPTMAAILTAGMFSGAAQVAALSVFAEGGGPMLILMTAMLVNARFVLLGASTAVMVQRTPAARVAMAAFLVDPIVVIVQRVPHGRPASRWLTAGGSVTLVAWSFGAAVGVAMPARTDFSKLLGLDMALPALLIAIIASRARSTEQRSAATFGALISAVLLLAGAPGSLAIVFGALGCVPTIWSERRSGRGGTALSAPPGQGGTS